ncbi:eCIS core domain-containing protein [Flavobacterium cheongpyeongense]|uniref:eCIS core domain-containing protein n=1 Tax=Flavobacterium cheongpyeongense TaxID=2212651 RepID=UPI001E32F05E|nr:DUF4157 domain-containing protein [Flavobacterium cheongpyeongense]
MNESIKDTTLQKKDNNRQAAANVVGSKGKVLNDNRPLIQKKANNTGLPDNLKSGIENLSGNAMDDVKVHYNSDKPAQLNAHAYAQGTDIHIASGQEKHLPHEAWHVVQQKQGRVKPTMQMKGKVNVNDDAGLEKEADVMGSKALQMKTDSNFKTVKNNFSIATQQNAPKQLMTTAYTLSDYSTEPNQTPFDEQVIINLIHARQGIPTEVKDKVDSYGDNGIGTNYNHYVPYIKLYESLENQIINQGKTRLGIVSLLQSHLKNIEICVTPGLTINPLKSPINFNTWVDAAIVAICDSPKNIFKGPHEGDGGGTKIDQPTDPSNELEQRLKMAALEFRMIGLKW